MTITDAVWNAMLDALETAIGPSAILKLRSGAAPASAASASTGTVIATMILASDWLTNASAGAKALQGGATDVSADASGAVGHFEICSSGGTPHLRDSVTATGGGGAITLDNVNVNAGQSVSITSYTISKPA